MSRSKGRLTLPDNPNLEQLREQAKERLDVIRTDAPDAQLSNAQLALARDYGFSSWRALKTELDRRSGAINGLIGYYSDPSSSNTLWSVTAKGQRLFVETSSRGAPIEVIPQPDGAFAIPGLARRYQFERDRAGKARAFIVQAETGPAVRAGRITAEKAAQMRAERDQAGKAEWRARTAIEVPADILERYVGYYVDAFGAVMQFTREDRKLFMQTATQVQVPLEAESEVDFFVVNARLEFHFRVQGDVATSALFRRLGTEAVLSRISAEAAADRHSTVSRRAAEQAQPRELAAPVPHEILAHYAGRYRIENGLEMIIEADEGRLFAQLVVPVGKPPRHEIYPESETKFFWTAMAAQVSFFADTERKISYGVFHRGGHLLPMGRIGEAPTQAAPAASENEAGAEEKALAALPATVRAEIQDARERLRKSRVTPSLEQSLHRAISLATERHHEYATIEHLLLSLTEERDAASVILGCHVDMDQLRKELTDHIDSKLEHLVTTVPGAAKPTTTFQHVVQRAILHISKLGRDEITGANVLVALFTEVESHAVHFLRQQGMNRNDAENYIANSRGKPDGGQSG